jgi:hypothetical protein
MAFDFDPQEVKTRLDECMEDGKLREILAKEGISESEPTTLNIICIDNDNMNVIKDYEIPPTNPKVPVTPIEINFDQEIKDWLDRAETDNRLLTALPKSDPLPDGTTKTDFNCIFNSSPKTKSVNFADCCNGGCAVCP